MAEDYKPDWAQKIEDWGKEVEERFSYHHNHNHEEEEPEEDKVKTEHHHHTHHAHVHVRDARPHWQRQNHPIGDIIGSIIGYLIVTYAPLYFPSFFLEGYSAVRIIIILSIIVHIIVSFLVLVIPVRSFYYLGRTITNIASVISMIVMVTIFPFNISTGLSHLIQFAFWIIIAILSAVTLFDFLNIFGSDRYHDLR